ncbi:homeobox protein LUMINIDEPENDENS [Typha angustifolia]|uniref:homeobox protein LUMINIDEPENDENS n=1 Tax=Typha angustifolia TaxID=59011 RepID=UPI003C2DA590
MALVPAAAAGGLDESDAIGASSMESLAGLVDSQKELFHSQIEQLQRLVVAQCKLTGVNPLAQEMAAGALSIKIGKKPRDLLNPKAVKYMQSVFSIKDNIGKKETREISALCGLTVTQVRDFFAGQRSRVRKLVSLSREKATILEASRPSSHLLSDGSDPAVPARKETPVNTTELLTTKEPSVVPINSGILNAVKDVQQVVVHSVDATNPVEATPLASLPAEAIPGVNSEDKKFLDDIVTLMRKEETFSGQVKLMEWVLQINDLAVLNWFLTKGGLTILATWLSEAATEEQTTVLLTIFKVLCHLPLHKALPIQMSAILQTVNRLRFYRTSDISNKARVLLSRLSKLFVRSQALKKPHSNFGKDARKEIVSRQRVGEILSDESWQSKIASPVEILALTENTENSRKSEPKRSLKLLPAPSDESSKKNDRSAQSSKTKERRKVLLVEQLDRKTAGRNVQVARTVVTNNSRPLSADDIQKAKMRAVFMKNKYGKTDALDSEDKLPKIENDKFSPGSHIRTILPASRISQLPHLKKSVEFKPLAPTENNLPIAPTANNLPPKLEALVTPKTNSASQENLMEKLKCNQIPWRTPPEVRIDPVWSVGAGENSKEVEIQTQRNKREKETIYPSPQEIPPNPKEPWDTEMDFDDSLTPEIPTEQPPDADAMEEEEPPRSPASNGVHDMPAASSSMAPPQVTNGAPEPDLELLAVLLKNPELVFALTSGQGKSLPSEQTVALLDLLKKSGVGLTELVNGLASASQENFKPPEPVCNPEVDSIPASLPSPTPPSDPAARSNWRSEFTTFAKAPVLQPHLPGIRDGSNIPNTTTQTLIHPSLMATKPSYPPAVSRLPAEAPSTLLSMPQLSVTINPSTHHLQIPPAPVPHQNPYYQVQQNSVPDAMLPPRHLPVDNVASIPPLLPRQEPSSYGRSIVSSNHMLPLHANPLEPQSALPTFPTRVTSWPSGSTTGFAGAGRRDVTPDRWVGRQNNPAEFQASEQRFFTNQNSYNAYPAGHTAGHHVLPGRTSDQNEILGRSEYLETWSPGGSPKRSPAYRGGWNFAEQRIDNGRNSNSQWNPGDRNYHRSGTGSSRRGDHDRDRRR